MFILEWKDSPMTDKTQPAPAARTGEIPRLERLEAEPARALTEKQPAVGSASEAVTGTIRIIAEATDRTAPREADKPGQ
jgi:hypothetical protein